MEGHIHSIESFGTVDGPGVRMVVFFQGCPMRCAYCHNPDTWMFGAGEVMSAQEVLERFLRNRTYYLNGGITVSGGEPLMQPDFLLELFRLAKQEGISTCLDTSGIAFPFRKNDGKWELAKDRIREDMLRFGRTVSPAYFEELAKVTDLVLLDIKQTEDEAHRELTGHSNASVFAFAEFLAEQNVPVWIRRVLVPELTSDPDELVALGERIGSMPNVKRLEMLPYHTMGVVKYEKLGIPYRLCEAKVPTGEEVSTAQQYVLQGVQKARFSKKTI